MHDDESVILQEKQGDILILTLNRPDRHNAMNALLSHRLGEVIAKSPQEDVKVIIITGAGDKSFCAGGDMLEMSGKEEFSPLLPPAALRFNGAQEIEKSPIPIIAAINGYCYGGGARLAILCDIRLASKNATFRLPGSEYGLVVAAATLPRLVGVSKAKEWIYTARRFDAIEALDAGLLSAVHPTNMLMDEALEMAKIIAQHSPESVQESKRVIDLATLHKEAVIAEQEANSRLRGSDSQKERFLSATRKVTGR
ncbi:MAG: enoyl-CoA hydratase/isomerase family protein [Dehalococcoidia bacterium]|nr:enoyl-CoA hydratase/isomerase family protein [Dehalococcoidia bacterium]